MPVWNGLTNEFHPTQMLADMLTIREHLGRLKGVKLVYMGDARYNMGNSLMVTCAKLGMHFVACTSENYFPEKRTGRLLRRSCKTDRRQRNADRGCSSREPKMQTLSVRMYGYPWVSLTKYGRNVSAN